jgi:uncharacterized protein
VSDRTPPQVDDVNRAFWTGGEHDQLMIQRCASCARWVHPPVGACPDCAGALAAEPVSGAGTVFTYTVNRHAFNPTVPVPYVIAIVELAEQADLRFTTNIVDCDVDAVHIGMPVELTFEPAGDSTWAPVFRPVTSHAN